jgi:hypothetical protein
MCLFSGFRVGGFVEWSDVRLENVFIFWFQFWG